MTLSLCICTVLNCSSRVLFIFYLSFTSRVIYLDLLVPHCTLECSVKFCFIVNSESLSLADAIGQCQCFSSRICFYTCSYIVRTSALPAFSGGPLHVPFVNRPFESEIHGTVNFTQFCCVLLVTWFYRVLLSCYLRPK